MATTDVIVDEHLLARVMRRAAGDDPNDRTVSLETSGWPDVASLRDDPVL